MTRSHEETADGISHLLQLDIEDFTVENALFRSFDALVRRQLDPVWHKVGAKTKGLVGDLTDLRMLNQSVEPLFRLGGIN